MPPRFPPRSVVDAVGPDLMVDWLRRLQFVHQNLVPFAVSSWWRDPGFNQTVGGAWDSQHLVGLAMDARPLRGSVDDLADAFTRVGLVPVLPESRSYVHVQAFPARMRVVATYWPTFVA